MKYILLIPFFLLLINDAFIYSHSNAIKTSVKPEIDGVLEDVWQKASKFTSFKQIEPEILGDATVRTESYFLYDEENFYVAMKMYQDKRTVRASNAKRDAEIIWDGDFISFSVDPLNNYTQAFLFGVNAANAISDGYIDENGITNSNWDGIFRSEVHISDDYWCVEIQVPLTTIDFQDKEIQDWNIWFFRHYSQNQEIDVSNLVDINSPYRLTNYNKLFGLSGLEKVYKFKVTPYIYSHNNHDLLSRSEDFTGKTGGEIRYSPSSSTTMLATFNPDYAQVETDQEVINVSDLPTEYPEKRPFFIESSDFYPGAAVNTRNIVDIKVGAKVRKLGDLLKYDLTGVLDGDNNQWLLSNIKLSKSDSYIAEIIGGIKYQKSRNDYNITTHLRKWFFENRLSLSNWIGTINMPDGQKNEWETVNSFIWTTREFEAGFWSQYKTKLYNPNIVGWNYLSNEVHHKTWAKYSIINEAGLFRTTSLNQTIHYFDLISPNGNSFIKYNFIFENTLNLGESLGNWSLSLSYTPPTIQKFRYRAVTNYDEKKVYEDQISTFVLIEDKWNGFIFHIVSDVSKIIGFSFDYDNNHVRKSKADQFCSEIYWKITPSSMIKYSFDYMKIYGSEYQSKFEQIIHRFQAEYNLTDKLNIRAIIQPNINKLPDTDNFRRSVAIYNLTLSWEYMSGSFIYAVYNNFKTSEKNNYKNNTVLDNKQSFILKINKSISF